nr:MAG TPA: hypothetical protein [Caudoviricetes sp.]
MTSGEVASPRLLPRRQPGRRTPDRRSPPPAESFRSSRHPLAAPTTLNVLARLLMPTTKHGPPISPGMSFTSLLSP